MRSAKTGADNRATHEQQKKELRREMAEPAVDDHDLKKIVAKIYRPGAKEGSGSTAAAIRRERITGERVGGAEHSQKGEEMITGLEKWLKSHPTSKPGDRAAAENLILDLRDALATPKKATP